MTSWNPSSDASYKADATAIPSTSKGEYTRLRVLDSEANIAPCASWITAPILDFCSLLNSAPSKLILTMSKIGALHWAQIGVDCGGGDGCTAWYFVRSSKAKFASWFGLHQGWLALTRFWCVHIVQTVTENNFKFYCLLIIQDSNSLKFNECRGSLQAHNDSSAHTTSSSWHDQRAWRGVSGTILHLSHRGSSMIVCRTRLCFVGSEF